jgi:hypothetical protein
MFDTFLSSCAARGIRPVPLRELLAAGGELKVDELVPAPIAGREGDVGWQRSALAAAARAAESAAARPA